MNLDEKVDPSSPPKLRGRIRLRYDLHHTLLDRQAIFHSQLSIINSPFSHFPCFTEASVFAPSELRLTRHWAGATVPYLISSKYCLYYLCD